jgi:hypothetical protein
VLDLQRDRVLTGLDATLTPIGWVERSALLCALLPLKGESGLEQKFYFLPTITVPGDTSTTVNAYPAPELKGCEGQCRELSGFEGYFVFDVDEHNKSYLLSETYRLDDVSQLVGWVSQENGFVWDTAYGLRPREDLVFPEGHKLSGMERIVCAYATIEDALTDPAGRCLPIPGGNRWYLSEHRIPLLKFVEYEGKSFYKVILSFGGLSFVIPFTGQEQSGKAIGQDHVFEAYIPVSDDIVEEVWLKSDDLDKWLSLLREFDNDTLSKLSGDEFRQAFVFALVDAIEKVIHKPLPENTEEPLKDYLNRKGGLPVRDDSPLFRYSLSDLLDPLIVPDCEIIRLTTWLNNSGQILNIIYHGDLRPVYTEENFPGECPTGGEIPFIIGDIISAPLGNNPDMRYNHSFQKANVYWVPKEYLP